MSDGKTLTQENLDAAIGPVRQNVQRLHSAATVDRERLIAALERVAALERTVASNQSAIQQLQQHVAVLIASSYGRGRTT